jgi:hypothetical protein
VVGAAVLLRTFDGDHITDILYHADGSLIPHGVGADRTYIAIADITATAAEADLLPHLCDRFAKMLHIVHILFQEVKHQAQGGLFTYTGQFGEFGHRIFQQH